MALNNLNKGETFGFITKSLIYRAVIIALLQFKLTVLQPVKPGNKYFVNFCIHSNKWIYTYNINNRVTSKLGKYPVELRKVCLRWIYGQKYYVLPLNSRYMDR